MIRLWKITGPALTLAPVFLEPESSSLDQITRQLPPGGYTTLRTFGKYRVLRFDDHINRLEETARLAGRTVTLDRAGVAHALRKALEGFPAEEARARICLDLTQDIGTIYILLEPLRLPSEADFRDGVHVVTRQMQRSNPKAKLTAFIATADDVRKALPPGINEAIMIGDDGRALEGLSSNFFGVIDGVIWTAGQGVLSGITRTLVLDVAKEMKLPLRLEGVPQTELSQLEEAFITSASRAVLPVVEIDSRPVGDGKPGPVTKALLQGYQDRIEVELDTL